MEKLRKVNFIGFSVVLVLAIVVVFTGCVTSYQIQTFSTDVKALPDQTVTAAANKLRTGSGTTTTISGLFEASNFEEAMRMAKEAGFTKLLSIEYGTSRYLGFIGTKWVIVRCAKE